MLDAGIGWRLFNFFRVFFFILTVFCQEMKCDFFFGGGGGGVEGGCGF